MSMIEAEGLLEHTLKISEVFRTRLEALAGECDRYSHLGLYSDDRVMTPEVKENGEWKMTPGPMGFGPGPAK